jgi:hypothetical protein
VLPHTFFITNMAQNIIFYKFNKLDPVKRKQFDRQLFGTIEKTHKGKYSTTIKGILTDIPYKKPVKSAIIVETKYVKQIENIVKKFGGKCELFKIVK